MLWCRAGFETVFHDKMMMTGITGYYRPSGLRGVGPKAQYLCPWYLKYNIFMYGVHDIPYSCLVSKIHNIYVWYAIFMFGLRLCFYILSNFSYVQIFLIHVTL